MPRTLIIVIAALVLTFLVFARLVGVERTLRSKADLEEDVFFILALTALLLTLVLLPTCVLAIE
jgi:hypothetical protein